MFKVSENKVFCETCQQCQEMNLFSFSQNKDDAFTTTGYDNWKNALAKFAKHETSKSHQEAVLKMASAKKGTDVAGLISTSVNRDREIARSYVHGFLPALLVYTRSCCTGTYRQYGEF
jgi:hypothetical protein